MPPSVAYTAATVSSTVLTLERLRLTAGHPETTLRLARGQTLALLGTDSSALSALLDLIAGHARAHGGQIMLDGQDHTHTSPGARAVVLIGPRNPLFPMLDVAGNIAFPARARHANAGEIAASSRRAIALLGLDGLERARIQELDALGQLRVALARAVVASPALLLLDEPYALLSPSERRVAEHLVSMLGANLGQSIALATVDRAIALRARGPIALFDGPTLLQCDSARVLFSRPADDRVATVFGDANALTGRVLDLEDDIARIRLSSGGIADAVAAPGIAAGDLCTLCVPPDRIAPAFGTLALHAEEDAAPIEAKLLEVAHLGDHVRMRFKLPDGVEVELRRAPLQMPPNLQPGVRAQLAWGAAHATAFPMRADMD